MSGGFSFPPPPPPPPKASGSGPGQQEYSQQRGRGRGRGQSGPQRGTGSRGGFTERNNYGASGISTSQFHPSNDRNGAPTLPPGAYVNPAFVNQPARSKQFSAVPAPSSRSFQPSAGPVAGAVASSSSPSRTHAGHKRKLEALRGPATGPISVTQTAPEVPSFGGLFSLPANPQPRAEISQPNRDGREHTRPAGRSLGLTPGTDPPQYSSSEDEGDQSKDLDEEAEFAELGDKLTFEHNGVVVSLGSQADLIAWRKERQRNWPTRIRMDEKENERRKVGAERRRLLTSAAQLLQQTESTHDARGRLRDHVSSEQSPQKTATDESAPVPLTDVDKARAAVEEQAKMLAQLRKKVAESESRKRRAQAQLDHAQSAGTGFGPSHGATDAATNSSVADSSTQDGTDHVGAREGSDKSSSSSTSDDSSESDTESEDSDGGPPEEVASKPANRPNPQQNKVCRYFSASGHCRDGENCIFRHERLHSHTATQDIKPVYGEHGQRPQAQSHATEPDNADKRTILERLLEQEEEGDMRLALQVIKRLGASGYFNADT